MTNRHAFEAEYFDTGDHSDSEYIKWLEAKLTLYKSLYYAPTIECVHIPKYFVRIDKSSIHRNPDAGQTSTLVPGKVCFGAGGEQYRSLQRIYHEPCAEFICRHETACDITCVSCASEFICDIFPDTISRLTDDLGYSDEVLRTTCPNCGKTQQGFIKYERLTPEMTAGL